MTSFPSKSAKDAKRISAEILSAGIVGSSLERRSGEVLEPIPIQSSDRRLVGWFVGIAVEASLVGFFVLGPKLEFRRYSTFLRHPGSLKGCPDVATWLDPQCILHRARDVAAPGESLGTPFLSYDQSPERIAWAVRAVGAKGNERTILVAGDSAYLARPGGKPSIG